MHCRRHLLLEVELICCGMIKMEKNSEEGFLMFTEGIFKSDFSLTASLRLQYFETGSYDSRIYAYENDVLFSYSIPAFFDKGIKILL
jgi:hypothetical protein